jgi:hypothetical protein
MIVFWILFILFFWILGLKIGDWILSFFGLSDAQTAVKVQQQPYQYMEDQETDETIEKFQKILEQVKQRHAMEGKDTTDDDIIRECVAETMALYGLESPKIHQESLAKPKEDPFTIPNPIKIDNKTIDDAWLALVRLGYRKTQVTKAVEQVVENATTNMSSAEIVTASLNVINNLR